ncbi:MULTISPECIES: FAD-dependent oxidoreductase [Flavobacterium]|uniref:FAD-dependent oxidoreductase n=1 Tax=Flavobacterium TaxID=237 RepID=UPI001182D968|nr:MULTISPECIES: FAD-dependent oxidoreductase [Flavobacterium]MCR4030690.1 FAD-dependent oxidoreductase [Flavobacterium panacis]
MKIQIIAFFLFCYGYSQNITKKTVDVLVIGGSTSGTSAGIASSRLGANTLIVEESPWIGGMFTSQGVGACDGNHNLDSGIWNEFRGALRDYYGGAAALETGWVSNTLFEPSVGNMIFNKIASKEKKLEIIHGFYIEAIKKSGNKVVGATFKNDKNDVLEVTAKVTIDATDIGESLKMAGTAYRLGMDSKAETKEENAPLKANNIVQDLTWVAILKDYGKDADKTIVKPENYSASHFEGSCAETVDNKQIDCDQMLTYGKLPNNKYMINWPKKGNDVYLNVIEMSREERNKELLKARNYTLQFVYYIQKELGYKNLGLADDEFTTSDLLAYAPYHREGRRLKGVSFLTYNHVAEPYNQKEALYKTGISVGDYPVDHHHNQNPEAPHVGFPPVPSYNIPLGALIPEKVDGFIVSDKAISVSNLINGATRLQPVVLLTGQAAGTLAALAVNKNQDVRNVSVRSVQQSLLDQKAYIMPLFDVKSTDSAFETIQKVTATGILKTKGESYQWANRTWFYPEQNISVQEFTEGLNQFDKKNQIVKSGTLLTEQEAVNLLVKAGAKIQKKNYSAKPINKRDLAVLIEEGLKAFEKEIDFSGNIKTKKK